MNRRVFFQSALSAAPLLQAQPGKKYKTALIGSGWWGMNILREAVASGQCSVVAFVDPDPNRLRAVSDSPPCPLQHFGVTERCVRQVGLKHDSGAQLGELWFVQHAHERCQRQLHVAIGLHVQGHHLGLAVALGVRQSGAVDGA
jgi:hypothetical protein